MKEYTFGAVIEYNYDFICESNGYTLDRISEPVNNFYKLVSERVDGVLEELMVGWNLAERANVAHLIDYHPKPIDSEPFYLIVSRNHPDAELIIDTFNTGLSDMGSSGRLEEIFMDEKN